MSAPQIDKNISRKDIYDEHFSVLFPLLQTFPLLTSRAHVPQGKVRKMMQKHTLKMLGKVDACEQAWKTVFKG